MLQKSSVKGEKSCIELVIRTIPVWNLSIRRARRPNFDIRCRNKELVLARGTGSRKFLNVA